MRTLLFALWLLLPALSSGTELAAAGKAEISHLFSYLDKSGCDFFRNGSWYKSSEASAHLQRKYEYLLGKGLVSSAESFIDRAATASSISGTPYQVRCGNAPAVESGPWFKAELVNYRKTGQ